LGAAFLEANGRRRPQRHFSASSGLPLNAHDLHTHVGAAAAGGGGGGAGAGAGAGVGVGVGTGTSTGVGTGTGTGTGASATTGATTCVVSAEKSLEGAAEAEPGSEPSIESTPSASSFFPSTDSPPVGTFAVAVAPAAAAAALSSSSASAARNSLYLRNLASAGVSSCCSSIGAPPSSSGFAPSSVAATAPAEPDKAIGDAADPSLLLRLMGCAPDDQALAAAAASSWASSSS